MKKFYEMNKEELEELLKAMDEMGEGVGEARRISCATESADRTIACPNKGGMYAMWVVRANPMKAFCKTCTDMVRGQPMVASQLVKFGDHMDRIRERIVELKEQERLDSAFVTELCAMRNEYIATAVRPARQPKLELLREDRLGCMMKCNTIGGADKMFAIWDKNEGGVKTDVVLCAQCAERAVRLTTDTKRPIRTMRVRDFLWEMDAPIREAAEEKQREEEAKRKEAQRIEANRKAEEQRKAMEEALSERKEREEKKRLEEERHAQALKQAAMASILAAARAGVDDEIADEPVAKTTTTADVNKAPAQSATPRAPAAPSLWDWQQSKIWDPIIPKMTLEVLRDTELYTCSVPECNEPQFTREQGYHLHGLQVYVGPCCANRVFAGHREHRAEVTQVMIIHKLGKSLEFHQRQEEWQQRQRERQERELEKLARRNAGNIREIGSADPVPKFLQPGWRSPLGNRTNQERSRERDKGARARQFDPLAGRKVKKGRG